MHSMSPSLRPSVKSGFRKSKPVKEASGSLMSPETELVVSLSLFPPLGSAEPRIERLLSNNLDWSAVLRRAAEWQVEPVVFQNLLSRYRSSIPPGQVERIATEAQQTLAVTVELTLVLMNLLDAFRQAGIPVIVLKGPAVGLGAYDDVSLRRFGDFDLLIPKARFADAQEVLLKRGYTPSQAAADEDWLIAQEVPLGFSGEHAIVDLHLSLMPRSWECGLDMDAWSFATEVKCLHSRIPVLLQEHLFLFLCCHGTKHRWQTFRWLSDITQLARGLSREQKHAVLALAARTHTRRMLALSVQLATEVFGSEPFSDFAEALVPGRTTCSLVAHARAQIRNLDAPHSGSGWLDKIPEKAQPMIFWIESRDRKRDAAVSLLRFLFVPSLRDFRFKPFHWVVRPFRLLMDGTQWVSGWR
jgi:hypothetical protein